ncbi:hypothetical protein [Methylotuvimicrobium buryatense]|uniref:Uncharacterized protein n=1 Tax=Methylotuvimicrobium buryatense TaxID=95641 RepID=A0A4P9UQF8_METBY|nr:hypothetical protein [Methylotuvimicrobium buryatense]QCW83669.1 hypothetical protein EQU24_16535 [Methylotuvimicrobium buryatense]
MKNHDQTSNVPILVWDTCDIALQQAQFLVESGEASDQDEGFTEACADSDLFTFEWEALTDCLTETMTSTNPDGHWHAEVENFGWRRQNGGKYFKAENGRELLHELLPNTECTFKIFLEDGRLRIQNFHHDAPTGNEWYTVRPVAP